MYTEQEVLKLIDGAAQNCIDLLQQNRNPEAEVILKQMLKIVPDHEDSMQLLGLTRLRQGKFVEAVETFTALTQRVCKHQADAYNNLGLCYGSMKKFDQAVDALQTALKMEPNNADFMMNLGMVYRQKDQPEWAVHWFTKAASIDSPNRKIAWFNLGSIQGDLQQLDLAEQSFRNSLELDPKFPAAHVDLAYALHLGGRWEEGFKHYEYRFKQFPRMDVWNEHFGRDKVWDGKESLAGEHLAVWCEQGVGDAIMFSRYLPRIRGSRAVSPDTQITVVAHPDTASFFQHHKEEFDIQYVSCVKPYHYHKHCSIVSLPHLLGLGAIPPTPLNVDPYDWVQNRQDKNALKVGVCWAGSPAHPHDRARSVHITRFEPLTQIPGVRLISLQREHVPRAYHDDPRPVNLSEGWEHSKIENIGDRDEWGGLTSWPDLSGLAKWIKGLDLVISVDTAVLHLAGTLGVQTWGLLPYNPDWRWELTKEKHISAPDNTVWYPSVLLCRQPSKGDWDSVFQEITTELRLMNKSW